MRIGSIAIVTGIALIGLNIATSAQAKDFDVHYSKAELKTPAGAERVYHRIYDISEDLCDYEFSHSFATKSRSRFNRCMRRTVKEFVGQIDHPNIDQIYAALPVRRIKDRLTKPVELAENKTK